MKKRSSNLKKALGTTLALTSISYPVDSLDLLEEVSPELRTLDTITTSNLAHDINRKFEGTQISHCSPQIYSILGMVPKVELKKIRAILLREPVIDCNTHPAELFINEALKSHGSFAEDQFASWIIDEEETAGFRADLLRLVSRNSEFSQKWRRSVVEACLASPDLEVRDAAAQAVENWGDAYFAKILTNHTEECDWLADYMDSLSKDLGD